MTMVLLSSSIPSYAQSPTTIYLGLRGGFNLGNALLKPEPPSGFTKTKRVDPVAGIYADVKIADKLYIAAEVLYLRTGFIENYRRIEVIEKLEYVNVPLSIKYKFFLKNTVTRPFLFVGPNFSFRIKSEESFNGLVKDAKESVKSRDVGIHIGGGLEYEAAAGTNVFIDGCYSFGLINVSKISSLDVYLQNTIVKMGVSFRLL